MPHDDGMNAKDRNCPYCGHTQFIDPADSLVPMKCENPGCEQESSYGAWCNPSDSPNCIAIAGESSIALTENIIRHTMAYTTEADGGGVASGTLISVGDRVLMATVAHSLTDDNSRIGLVGKDVAIRGDRSRWVIQQVKHPNGDFHTGIDVGIVELDKSVVSDLKIQPLILDRVHDAGSGSPVLKTRVVGFPWELKQDDVIQRGVRAFRAFSYGCETIHTAAWHRVPIGKLRPEWHLLAHYEREDNIDWKGDYVESSPAPKPHGMSGGGYWQRSKWLEDLKVWQPSDLCFCGIQSGYVPKRSLIVGVQIIHWLKLVTETYPDTKAEIERRFPRVNRVHL